MTDGRPHRRRRAKGKAATIRELERLAASGFAGCSLRQITDARWLAFELQEGRVDVGDAWDELADSVDRPARLSAD